MTDNPHPEDPEHIGDGPIGDGASPPGRRRSAPGSFSRSLASAAARGSGLVAVAVAIGIVLLQYSDEPRTEQRSSGKEPASEAPLAASSTTTSTVPGPRAPADVRVLVVNASGRSGVAGEMTKRLEVVGYPALEPGNAALRPATTVGCREGFEREAEALVSATGLDAQLADPGDLLPTDADCVVVIGSA